MTVLGKQMNKEISGKRISEIEVSNPKCLNMPFAQFRKTVVGRTIEGVESRGKWIFFRLSGNSVLLFNPGMGADVIHFKAGGKLPGKYRLKFVLDDKSGLTIHVWWFCYLHLVRVDKLSEHRLAGKLGVNPIDKGFTLVHFKRLLAGKKGNIKTFMLDQKNVAGIGNVYLQDMLFLAKVHPQRAIPSLTDKEVEALYKSMRLVLNESIRLGGLQYEKDFYGKNGRYGPEQFRVAYKPGKPCPVCQTTIQKIKTGSTSTFICPKCQPLTK